MKSLKSWAFRAPSPLLVCGVAAMIAACEGAAPVGEGSLEKAGEAVSASYAFPPGPPGPPGPPPWPPGPPGPPGPLGPPPPALLVSVDKLCLQAFPGELENGATLFLSRCEGCSARWVLTDHGEILGPGGMCLDAAWGHTVDGTAVRMWECNGTESQQWRLNPDGSISGPGGKCLDTRFLGTPDLSALELQCCDGSPGQQWYLRPA